MNEHTTTTADLLRLVNLPALSAWTLDRQREHSADLATYEAALAAFQSHLRSQHVEGDGRLSAARRARKVERHLRGLARASKKAVESAEALRIAYAGHVAAVAALPAQREAKALRRADRRQAVGEVAAKSLHKTVARMAPEAVSGDVPGEPPAAPAPVRGVDDLFRRGA